MMLLMACGPRLRADDRMPFRGKIISIEGTHRLIIKAGGTNSALFVDHATRVVVNARLSNLADTNLVPGVLVRGYGFASPLDGFVARWIDADTKPREKRVGQKKTQP